MLGSPCPERARRLEPRQVGSGGMAALSDLTRGMEFLPGSIFLPDYNYSGILRRFKARRRIFNQKWPLVSGAAAD